MGKIELLKSCSHLLCTVPLIATNAIMPPAKSNIPADVLLNILSRALGRLKCVSKQWCNLISDPYFVHKHLETCRHPEKLVLVIQSRFLCTVKIDEVFDNAKNFTKIVFDPDIINPNRQIKVMGSCNGLLLIIDEMGCMFLVNPTTRESKKMLDLLVRSKLSCGGYGFGYDPSTDDYMVIAIFYAAGSSNSSVFLYTLKTDSWKKIQSSPYKHVSRSRLSGGLVNGNLHWLANYQHNDAMAIAAFSLVDQKFWDVPFPSFLAFQPYQCNDLAVLGGCLCLIGRPSFLQVHIFMMSEYGKEESWGLYFAIHDPINMSICKPLCMLGDGEVVWDADGDTLFAYKPAECLWRYRGLLSKFECGGTFWQTLVLPNAMAMTDEKPRRRGWLK